MWGVYQVNFYWQVVTMPSEFLLDSPSSRRSPTQLCPCTRQAIGGVKLINSGYIFKDIEKSLHGGLAIVYS